MRTAAFVFSLFVCMVSGVRGHQLEDLQWQCREGHLWIHMASQQTPQFEAIDERGAHSVNEQLASRCGYTISSFNGFTTFRASYFSCFTLNQNDEVFTFRLNVVVGGGGAGSRQVSAVCSGVSWTHREMVCEENYMEVNVDRESSCGGQRGGGGGVAWQAAFTQAQKMASSSWQLSFLKDEQVTSMSVGEAEQQGFSLTAGARRVVLRSGYRPVLGQLMEVDGVPVEVVRVSLFFKQKLMVVMMDLSIACSVNSGSFDGSRLIWDVPQVLTPLVEEGVSVRRRSHGLGIGGVLLDESSAAARGLGVLQQGGLVRIHVPFGADGGHQLSWVVNNVYQESYVISLLYQHVFSALYEDGSSIDTRHRTLRLLEAVPLCRKPFILDQTRDEPVFSVYLGNVPADVVLEEVHVNGKPLLPSQALERGSSVTPVVHRNGSKAYELRLPYEDPMVHWTYVGDGVVQYAIDVNFTLTIRPQGDSYYHHTFITARVRNSFPPKITAQCSDRGITFSVVRSPHAESRWEVGVDQEPLTPQLAAQRGYGLHTEGDTTVLEVPLFSIGYMYDDINLSNFYGTFKLLLRDARTQEVQASTSKQCLFKTEDMIVCSADGTMTVVTTPAATWPIVQPEKARLLDPTCRPKQTDGFRVLFQFKQDSCGTRATVTDSYVVYENEILHDRQLINDGPNFISRESQFKLTVRCFYPLSGVTRLTVDRTLRSESPRPGAHEGLADSTNTSPDHDCPKRIFGNVLGGRSEQVHESSRSQVTGGGVLLQPPTGPPNFITVPRDHSRMLSSQNHHTMNSGLPPPEQLTFGTHRVPRWGPAHPAHLTSYTDNSFPFEPLSQRRNREMTNSEEKQDHEPQSQYGSSDTVLQTPAPFGHGHVDNPKLKRFKKVPNDSEYTTPDLSGDIQGQFQQVGEDYKEKQRAEKTGSIERRTAQTGHPGVQNIRVKPPKTITGFHLSHKQIIQGDSQRSRTYQGSGVLPQPPGPSGSHTGERSGSSTLRQENMNRSAATHPTVLLPNQPRLQQNLVDPDPSQQPGPLQSSLTYVAETRHTGGRHSTPPQRAEISHIRVRPGLGFPRELQDRHEASTQKHPFSTDDPLADDTWSNEGAPGSHGDVQTSSRLDCGDGPAQNSVHRGLLRGG